ncbi:MAG: hypothetical protein ABI678_10375, partial [Kofleriaceae bacterium]
VMFLVVVGACYSEEPGVGVGVAYGGGGGYGYAAAPQMEVVAPGVQVIADYDYPVFYSDGAYWRYDGGLWYRSGYYNRGWGVSYNVPMGVRGISRPDGYRHYHGGGYYRGGYRPNTGWGGGARQGGVRTAPAYRGGGSYRGGGGSTYRGGSRPVVRDHRR